MILKLKLHPYTVCVWVLLVFCVHAAKAQTYYGADRGMDIVKTENKTKFNYRKFKISLVGAVIQNSNTTYNPGPWISNSPISSFAYPNFIFELTYKHSRWISPSIIYRPVKLFEGTDFVNLGKFGASWLYDCNGWGIGNRFYLVEKLLFENLKLSSGIYFIASFKEGNYDNLYSGKLKLIDRETNDSLVFRSDAKLLAKFNFLVSVDLLLELQLFKNIDIGIGAAYYQGFNRIVHTNTTYEYKGVNYSSDKYLNGGGFQPFLKVTIKFKE